MAKSGGTAEILDMGEARARLRAAELSINDFASVGGYLACVREASGLTVAHIAEKTHIRAEYLDAIELMEIDALPSRPFAIGFVKTYAEALGVDPAAAVARLKENLGVAAPAAPAETGRPSAEAVEPADRSHLSLFAVIAVLGFIIWCALMISRPGETTTPLPLDDRAIPATPAAEPAAAHVAPAPGAPPLATPDIVEATRIGETVAVYPRRCESGAAPVETVEIAFNVMATGSITGERVAASSNPCFNDAALNAARLWTFSPRTVGGEARAAYDLRHVFTFRRPS
jgi:TonB family protein